MLHNLQTGLGSFWLWIDGKEVGVVLNKNKYDKTGWLSAIWKVFKSNRLPSVYQIFVKASSWPLLCFLRAKQKQSVGILILPLSCSCSNKVKTNKQTNKVKTKLHIVQTKNFMEWTQTNKMKTISSLLLQLGLTNKNKHAKWKQQHYRNSYKRIHHWSFFHHSAPFKSLLSSMVLPEYQPPGPPPPFNISRNIILVMITIFSGCISISFPTGGRGRTLQIMIQRWNIHILR